ILSSNGAPSALQTYGAQFFHARLNPRESALCVNDSLLTVHNIFNGHHDFKANRRTNNFFSLSASSILVYSDPYNCSLPANSFSMPDIPTAIAVDSIRNILFVGLANDGIAVVNATTGV